MTFNIHVLENQMTEAEQYTRTMITAGVDATEFLLLQEGVSGAQHLTCALRFETIHAVVCRNNLVPAISC